MTLFPERMDLLVYTPSSDATIAGDLGRPEYSYFFVMKRFLPLLGRYGRVTVITDLESLDTKRRLSQLEGRIPILVAFCPPHLLPIDPPCVVLPVFAWEFDTVPNETWTGDPRQNWIETLRALPAAITHSTHTQAAVQQVLGLSYPIASIPAPVWDCVNKAPLAVWDGAPRTISFDGQMVDSASARVSDAGDVELRVESGSHRLALGGLVFTSVLTPLDSRKNVSDIVTAFVYALRDGPDATLVLKLSHFDPAAALAPVIRLLQRLYPHRCRVVALAAFLDDDAYRDLKLATAFAVNASVGEGQCLPLMEFLAAGRPAVAPNHTAMADYIDARNGFIVGSSPEWTSWPPDPRGRLRCMQRRIDWNSLKTAYLDAASVATGDPDRYGAMSRHARERSHAHNSIDAIVGRLDSIMALVSTHAIEREELRVGQGQLMKRLLGVESPEANAPGQDRGLGGWTTDARMTGLVDARMSGWFRLETAELFEGFSVSASDIVVDVGCGEGQHLAFCAKFGARVIGVDIDPQSVRLARAALSNSAAREIEFHEASAERLPLPDGLATRIICSEALEHVDDVGKTLAELMRIGAPGALYLFTVPDRMSEEMQRDIAPDQYFRKPNHVRVFEREALPEYAASAGLEVLSHTSYGFFWSVWWALFWGCDVDLNAPHHPALEHWSHSWRALMESPDGPRIKAGLDAFLPKSRVVLARKPRDGAHPN